MPSLLFQELASSQLELLANSLFDEGTTESTNARTPKVESMALYLPQENPVTGQLEFTPAVLFPSPQTERIFIASDSNSGVAPTLPRTLTKLPGFAHAATLMPHYPMMTSFSEQPGVGTVEEVTCGDDNDTTPTTAIALSVPLFAGPQTVGVVLITPVHPTVQWTVNDKQCVAQAAKSLSLALSMDSERNALRERNMQVQDALSERLHQVKNPIQALRTYGKLLQRRMVDEAPQLLELTDHLIEQSDRLVYRLKPVDAIVEALSSSEQGPFVLNPVEAKALVPWRPPLQVVEEEGEQSSSPAEPSLFLQRKDTTNSPAPNDTNALLPSLLGEVNLQMSFLDDLLEPIFNSFRTIAEERKIQFDVEYDGDLPGVTVCSDSLQEAVINILDNAVKYVLLSSTTSPKIRVRLCPVADGASIQVDDNGPGIPRSSWNHVFDRGVRLESASSNAPGSGLGLYLAREFVEQRMGGSIRIVDPTLGGTSVEVTVYRQRQRP